MQCRPSELLGIKDTYLAYCVDEAIDYGHVSITNELEAITHKKSKVQAERRSARLHQLLGIKKTAKQFKDPAARTN